MEEYLFSPPKKYLLGFSRVEKLQSTEAIPYEVWHCNLKLDIVHSQTGANCSCMAFPTWVSGALHLTEGTWGHWAAAAANAVVLLSCILTCCPWLPAPVLTDSPEEADLHPVAQQEKAQPEAVWKPCSWLHRVTGSLVHPLTPSRAQSLELMVIGVWVGAQAWSPKFPRSTIL